MDLDKDYYFEPLLKDRTLFFVILPKYLNVDIRIMLDVNVGGNRLRRHSEARTCICYSSCNRQCI